MQQDPINKESESVPVPPVAFIQPQSAQTVPVITPKTSFDTIRHATAWVTIVSAVIFALIGILAIWQVFGTNTGDVVWRAFSSLATIAFAALIVNVASRMVEVKH